MKNISIFQWIGFWLMLFLFTGNLTAQDKPKIGLVLSGGGAKGLAHIGILKEMEKAGLRPDYITGTSMGSIIGGLYAIGYSAEEIEQIAMEVNWEELLTNQIPTDKVAYEEKNYYGRYLADFPIKNGKIGLPGGLIEGQELNILLSNLTRSAHGINDFDDFPIPFACVATNIETGKAKVFRSGSLPETLRASMAIPSVFTPVEIDDELYVDGGLVRNFPVDEVIDMGADIVIGVFVSDSLAKKQKLNSMVSVLIQSAFVMSALDSEDQMKRADMLIFPDLENYGTYSFDKSEEIIEKGKESAALYASDFRTIADSLNRSFPEQEPMNSRDIYKINTVNIKGNNFVDDELILGKLRIREGDSIKISTLEKRINLLYGTQYFEKIIYRVDSNTETLFLKVKEAPRGSLKLGVQYDTENEAGLVAYLTLRNFIFRNSRMIAEYNVGDNSRFFLNFFKYLGTKQNVAVALDMISFDTEIPSYWAEANSNKSVVSGILKENDLGFFLRMQGTFASNRTFGVMGGYLRERVKPSVLDSIIINVDDNPVSASFNKLVSKDWLIRAYYKHNDLDRFFFPNRGNQSGFSFSYYFNRDVEGSLSLSSTGEILIVPETDNFWKMRFFYNPVFEIKERWVIEGRNEMNIASANDELQFINHRTQIGGFNPQGMNVIPFLGVDTKRFSNVNFLYSGWALRWQFLSKLFWRAHVNYIDSEYPMKWVYRDLESFDFGAHPRRFGFATSLAYSSPLGPITIAVAKDQYLDDFQMFLSVGFYFREQ